MAPPPGMKYHCPGEIGAWIRFRPEETMRLHFNLQILLVFLAALGLWAVIGGWYVALAPVNLSGPDNIGIVLSTFGVCLFLADRLAGHWLKINCWVLVFKLWFWGLIFVAWGLVEWLNALKSGFWLFFILHWLGVTALLVVAWLLCRRSARNTSSRGLRESIGPISPRRKQMPFPPGSC